MQTLGTRLKAAREQKNLTLEKVFQATRIRVAYLQALEDDDLSFMPSPVQARGYLRNYAEYLGLDLDRVLEEVRAAQENAGRIIAPADPTSTLPAPAPEPFPSQEALPPAPPVPDTTQEVESQPADIAQDTPEPVTPKRRGQKKVEPVELVEEKAEPAANVEPQSVAEGRTPLSETLPASELPPSQADRTDGLWQIWLNRVRTVFPGRATRGREETADQTMEPVAVPGSTVPSQPSPEPISAGPSQPANLPVSADAILKEIGAELRERRENLSLHLEEVERNTKVKAHYLEALEQGALNRLPSTVQTRGMLSNYASFLDMDVDAILLRFADALQARHRERNPQIMMRKPVQPILANMPALRNFIAGDMIFGVGMAVLLVGFVIWGINRVLTLQGLEEIEPTAPSISDVLLASPDPSQFTATPTLLPVEAFSDEPTSTIEIPTVNVNISVQVSLVAVERTYVRVIVDGEVVFEGRVIPGNVYLYEAEEQVEVLVGSGGAVRVAYNGRDLGLMGTFGQVVSIIYRAAEIVTPTPLATATPTNTVPPSATLRPTNTPPPSNTPLP